MTKPEQTTKLAEAVAQMPEAAPKDAKNKFKKYDYASADSLYRTIRPALAEAGYLPWQNEVSMETIERDKGEEKSHWIKAVYEMAITPDGIAPKGGESERITVMCQLNDAQSFQALRTYALKYYLRGKTLTATGELDVDDTGGDAPPVNQEKEPPRLPTGMWALNLDTMGLELTQEFPDEVSSHRALMRTFHGAFKPGSDLKAAEAIYLKNSHLIETLPKPGQEMLIKAFEALRATEKEKQP